jgi:hypothetical protein
MVLNKYQRGRLTRVEESRTLYKVSGAKPQGTVIQLSYENVNQLTTAHNGGLFKNLWDQSSSAALPSNFRN